MPAVAAGAAGRPTGPTRAFWSGQFWAPQGVGEGMATVAGSTGDLHCSVLASIAAAFELRARPRATTLVILLTRWTWI